MWAARPTAQWCRSRGPRRDPSRGHPDAVALHDIARCARPLADHYRWLSYVRGGLRHRRGDDDRLRVNVQFIEVETGAHLWAERFDKPIADLFEMQDEIVSRLANRLGPELMSAEARRAERSAHPNSMDHYFLGLSFANKGITAEISSKARSHYDRAIDLDGNNVDALVSRANLDLVFAANYLSDDHAERRRSAEADLGKALKLSPDNAKAHCGFPRCWREIPTRRSSSSAFTTLGTVTHDPFAHASACNETRHACHESPDRSPSARPSGDDGG